MSFSNLAVSPDEMPKAEDLQLKPIHPDYLKSLRLTWTLALGILLILMATPFLFIDKIRDPVVISIAAVIFILITILTVAIGTGSFRRKSYAVREHDIIYRTGWIVQKLHVVPFNRIQHAAVKVGPIDRKFGLASLTVFTAASMLTDISLKGLPEQEAEKIREYIMQKIKPIE